LTDKRELQIVEEVMIVEDVKTWREAQGKKEYVRHMKGETLTMKQAILGECYSCTGGYFDGKRDCEGTECVLYQFMPYRKNKIVRERSERQKANDAKAGLRLLNRLIT
jgi:hypothetical protein